MRVLVNRIVLCGATLAVLWSAAGAATPAGAFFRSLVVPGWGQIAVGAPRRAVVFGSIEGALLAGAYGVGTMRGIYRDDYLALARSVAGADITGKGDDFFSDLAFYETRAHHNQAALVFDQPTPMLYGSEDDWQWPTTADRMNYRQQWNRSRSMNQRLDYLFFAVSLNHLASAVDAAKQASRLRESLSERTAARSRFLAVATPDRMKLVWALAF
jgi:hypothetical protein